MLQVAGLWGKVNGCGAYFVELARRLADSSFRGLLAISGKSGLLK